MESIDFDIDDDTFDNSSNDAKLASFLKTYPLFTPFRRYFDDGDSSLLIP